MNKDLDERIIPNGQYRDAMNVKVTSSDDASVGTVQNLLGNYRVEDIVPVGYVCIATVADEKTNCLYWFVTNRQTLKHAILQYNIYEEAHKVVLLDEHNSVLKFSEKIITGINVINNLLFWTDNNSEPKKINIHDCIQGTTQLQSLDTMLHTKLFVDGVVLASDIEEEHITVIKKNPKIAPSFTINKPTDSNASRLFEQVFPRFSLRYKYKDGEYSSFGPFTDVVFNPIYTEDFSIDDFYSVKESYNTAMVNSIESIELKNFISSDVPKDVTQVEILYKEDGSSVVFSIKTIDYDDAEWTDNVYTLKSEAIFAAIPSNQFLRPFDNVPTKALAQEITGNRLVYGNYTQNYDLLSFGNVKVKPKIEARYNKRPLNDDFTSGGLPSLKAQREYQLGLVFGDKYGRETPVFTSESGGVSIPYKDTERNIGLSASNSLSFSFNLNTLIPTWADYYKVYVKETSGDYYNLIMTKAYAQTSLNVFDEEEDRVWLAFPSADRNKVTEDDYLILKRKEKRKQVALKNKFKILDISNEAPDAVKFEYISLGDAKQDQLDGGVTRYLEDNTNGDALFDVEAKRIDQLDSNGLEGLDTIHVRRDSWINVTGGGSLTEDGNNENMYVDNIYIMWRSPGQNSEKYKVVSIFVLNNVYQIKLNRKITEFDAIAARNTDTTNYPDFVLKHDLIFSCERKIEKDLDEFSGKFFVQIVVSSTIKKEQTTEELLEDFVVGAVKPTHWFMDDEAGGADPTLGIINASPNLPTLNPAQKSYTLTSITSGPTVGYSGVDADWVLLARQLDANKERGFFIDNMAFAAGQSDNNNFAKNAGETWKGWGAFYPKHPVWTQLTDAQTNPIPDTYGWTMSGAIGGDPNNSGYQVLNPEYYNPRPFGGVAYPVDETLNINGLEGFITTDVSHIRTPTTAPDGTVNYFNSNVGYRGWKNGELRHSTYSANPYDGVSKDGQTGKFFMHLSFLGPGKDLVSSDAFNGSGAEFSSAKTFGRNSVGNFMQGIWGGGVFGDPTANGGNGVIVEMEGNYDDNDIALSETPRVGFGQGYNNAGYGDDFDGQWDPLYGDDSTELEAFVDNLVEGKTFRFTSNGEFLNNATEVFKIKSVTTKKLYNHTPWKAQYKWDGSNSGSASVGSGLVTCGNSVDEAAIAWANTIDNGNPNGEQVEFEAFQDRVISFGKTHNRRLVYIIELDKDPTALAITGVDTAPNVNSPVNIEFITTDPNSVLKNIIQKPAIWETEAKPGENLDLYYEASQAYSFKLNDKTNQNFAPIGCKVEILLDEARNGGDSTGNTQIILDDVLLESWNGTDIVLSGNGFNRFDAAGTAIDYVNTQIRFFRPDGSYTTTRILYEGDGPPEYVQNLTLDSTLDVSMEHGLSYYNCYSFGDGVESNRIRGDFNSPSISKGVKASLVLDQEYKEENRKNGLIFSGIYNSTSGVNSLNQFIMAENITKDLNPTYGSIQKLFQRRVSLVAFCEDRVVSITSNKDQLFNADGNPQLIASNAVLGDATPFVGDFGISKNPESFAKESYRAYFADKQRGAILRLSMDGITPISEAGMTDFFRDNLKVSGEIVGSYDAHSKNYNLTLKGRKPENNIINNSSFDAGVSSDPNPAPPELVVDGSLNNIDALVLPDFDIANQLIQNRNIDTNCTIENFSYLPAGFWPETLVTSNVTTSNSVFSAANYTAGRVFNQTFSGLSSWWLNSTPQDPFRTKAGNTNEDQQYRAKTTYDLTRFSFGQYPETGTSVSGSIVGFSGDVIWYDGTYEDYAPLNMSTSYFPLNQVTASGDGQLTSSVQGQEVNTEGIAFDRTSEGVILPGEHKPAPPPPPPSSGTMQTNNTNVPSTVLLHTNTVDGINAQPYVNMKDNTIINGEQIRLIIKFKNNAEENPFGIVNPIPAPRRVKISLWDGYDLATRVAVPDTYIFDPITSSLTTALPYGDYADNPFPDSSTFKIGYATTATVEFADMSAANVSGDYVVEHEVYFKFNDDTEEEKILVQDLQVQIELLDDNQATYKWGVLRSFQMRKNYRLVLPETIATTNVGQGDALPAYDVQAFAEVEYGATGSWSIDFYDATYPGGTLTTPNLAYFGPNMDSTYGSEYIGVEVSGTQADGAVHTWTESADGPGGGSNGTTGFNDHVDGVKYVNDKFEFAGVDQFGNPSEAVLKQSYTTVTSNWYMLDLDINGGPISGALPRLLDFEVDFFQTTELDNYSGASVDIYRCVFQGDDTFDTLKILFYANTVCTVRKLAMLDITTTWSGGTHTNGDWHFNYGTSNNPYPINSLSQPTIWASANGIEFNTDVISGGTYTSVFQNLPTGLNDSTLGGYEFRFKIRNYAGYPYGGGLSFYCIGDNDGMEAVNLITTDGDYLIQGNLDGGAYNIEYETTSGQVFSVGSTSQASINTGQRNIINFFSNGFIGSVTDVSFVDSTNYFVGGSAGSFNFSGFDNTVQTYIDFQDDGNGSGLIMFNNSPILGATGDQIRIEQYINRTINDNDFYRFEFKHVISTGSISGYYFNHNGKGFRFNGVTGDNTYNALHEMQDDIAVDGSELGETLVIFVEQDSTSGTIDNISLRREFIGINEQTVSFSESVRGWVSFKSFMPEQGVSLSSQYFTVKSGGLWEHDAENVDRNTFYNIPTESSITAVLNESPSSVKIFNTLNYEGSQSLVVQGQITNRYGNDYNTLDTYNLIGEPGWSVDYLKTDKQEGTLNEFIEKEGKWFNYIRGLGDVASIKTSDLSFQGLGVVSIIDPTYTTI